MIITVAVVAALFGVSASQEKNYLPAGNIWFGLLGSDRIEDTQALIKAAPKAVDDFECILNSPTKLSSHASHIYCILPFARVDNRRFLKPALRDLNDTDETVRRCAATFIGHVGNSSEFAAPLMMLMLYDPKAEVSIAAREALGKVGDASTVVALEHLIRFGTGKPDTPPRNKELAEAFVVTRDQIKARLAAAAKAAPAPPK